MSEREREGGLPKADRRASWKDLADSVMRNHVVRVNGDYEPPAEARLGRMVLSLLLEVEELEKERETTTRKYEGMRTLMMFHDERAASYLKERDEYFAERNVATVARSKAKIECDTLKAKLEEAHQRHTRYLDKIGPLLSPFRERLGNGEPLLPDWKEIELLIADHDRLREEKEKLVQMLEDVVNELDLSDSAIAEHGPMGTPPAQLVRLVMEQKDKTIRMLEAGMVDAQPAQGEDQPDA